MRTLFANLQSQIIEQELGHSHQTYQLVSEFTDFLISTQDTDLLDISKRWTGYGTWKSVAFVNEYHYGDELAKILRKSINGSITHNEDYIFDLEDFRDKIEDEINEHIYHNS